MNVFDVKKVPAGEFSHPAGAHEQPGKIPGRAQPVHQAGRFERPGPGRKQVRKLEYLVQDAMDQGLHRAFKSMAGRRRTTAA